MFSDCHLILQELRLKPTAEWSPAAGVWTLARLAGGFGYLMKSGVPQELEAGDVFVTTGGPGVVVRASSLVELKLDYFFVHPEWLNGLLTVPEGRELAHTHRDPAEKLIFFRAREPVGQKFARLAAQSPRDGLAIRTALLQLWSQAIAAVLPPPEPDTDGRKLRERFRRLLSQLPHTELARQSLDSLAAQINCSGRHFSRLFRQEFGVSLRTRQTELRLQLARELLLSPDVKIASVARQSGYRHLGLFNAMFKRQFGMTPTAWRQKMLSASCVLVFHLFVT